MVELFVRLTHNPFDLLRVDLILPTFFQIHQIFNISLWAFHRGEIQSADRKSIFSCISTSVFHYFHMGFALAHYPIFPHFFSTCLELRLDKADRLPCFGEKAPRNREHQFE